MRKNSIRAVALALILLAAAATPALADVHGVSNAGCAPDGVRSGATQPASRAAPGRPDGPIPENASESRTQGRASHADPSGTNCPPQ
jgi:hypothetical protein